MVFAPLYVSDYCVNNCVYCGYKRDNKFTRRKLTMEEVAEEVKILEKMGHKRLALELGEDPVNAPIDYALECLDTIYKTQNEKVFIFASLPVLSNGHGSSNVLKTYGH